MSLHGLFEDAHRRACIQKSKSRDGAINLDTLWSGLAFPSWIDAKARKFFRPLDGKEVPRTLNWYLFTEAGKAEYLRRYADAPDYFEKVVN